MALAAIILAAGKGTRMNSDLPKVLHRIGNAALVEHVVAALAPLEPDRMIAVTGHQAALVAATLAEIRDDIEIVAQDEQLGTAHAVLQAGPSLTGFAGTALVVYGDTPFIRPETLQSMIDAHEAGASVVVLGFETGEPGLYGRLVRNAAGGLERIVEAAEATPAERAITLCNSGVVCAEAGTLFSLLAEVGNANAKGEYYLTDIVGIARKRGLDCAVVTCPPSETLGVDSRAALIAAEALFQRSRRAEAIDNGVTLIAPETVYFSADTQIGGDTVIEPNVVFGRGVTVENGAIIHAFSHLEGCHVGQGAAVGPFARLRPGAQLDAGAKVGNFVEIKNAVLEAGAKVSHLSYIGDAQVGEAANIGAGTITCNYDGVFKHQTRIGARAFIGSNSALVAPVSIGDEALVAAGSVITGDVPAGDLAVARGKQTNIAGMARRMMARLRQIKADGKRPE